VGVTFMKSVGLSPEQATVYVNNRKLMNAEFEALDIPQEKRVDALSLVDRRSKMIPANWDAYALEIGLSQAQLDGLRAVLDNFDLWKKDEELTRLFVALEALGVKEYVKFDPSITRGLFVLHWHGL